MSAHTRVTIVLTEAERDALMMALGGSGKPTRQPTIEDTRAYLSARAKLLAHDAALRARAREAEEREAKWRRELSAACELSERAREIVITALNQPPEHFYDKHDNGEWSAEHIAFAIRSLFRERDEARRLIAGVHPDDRSALAVNILRVWPRAEIETFARHLLGEPTREQESLLLGQLQTQVQIRDRQIADLLRTIDLRERERDEAREQLAKERRDRIAAEEALAAALRARAQRLVEAGLEVKRAGAAIIASVGSGGPLSEIEWEGACEVFDAAAKADAHAKGEGR